MPNQLPGSVAHALWVVAVMIVAHTTVSVWSAHHRDSPFAQALATVL